MSFPKMASLKGAILTYHKSIKSDKFHLKPDRIKTLTSRITGPFIEELISPLIKPLDKGHPSKIV